MPRTSTALACLAQRERILGLLATVATVAVVTCLASSTALAEVGSQTPITTNQRAPICASSGHRIIAFHTWSTSGPNTPNATPLIQTYIREMDWKVWQQSWISSGAMRGLDMKFECDSTGAVRVYNVQVPMGVMGPGYDTTDGHVSVNDAAAWVLHLWGSPELATSPPDGSKAVKYMIFHDWDGTDGLGSGGGGPWDGNKTGSDDYGASANWHRVHTATSVAALQTAGAPGAQTWDDYTAVHELFHTLGATVPGAPFAWPNGGHCFDGIDIMCYDDGSNSYTETRCPASQGYNTPNGVPLDCGYDTYFNASPNPSGWLATHWNVAGPEDPFLSMGRDPVPTTTAATSIGRTTATLNGTVNPKGLATTYHFEYGTTTAYGASTSEVAAGSGTSPVSAQSAVGGLMPGTTYHYRLVASNLSGVVSGPDQTVTTRPPVVFADATAGNTVSYWTDDSNGHWQQTQLFASPVAAGSHPVFMTIDGYPAIFFVQANRGNQITEWTWSPSAGWQQTFLTTDPVSAGSSPAALNYNGTPELYFSDAADNGSITALVKSGASWQQTPFFGDPVAANSSPSVINSNGMIEIYFADGANNRTITLWEWGSSLTQVPFYGDSLTPNSSPSAIINNGTIQVYFANASKSNTIALWSWSPSALQQQFFYGDAVAGNTSPSAISNNGTAQIYFVSAPKGNTIAVWNWSPTALQLSGFYQDAVMANSSPSAVMDNGYPDIFYADGSTSNSVSYWRWSSSISLTKLGSDAVMSGSSPTA